MPKIFPGNYVNTLDFYKGVGAVCQPGRVYYQAHGYAKITSTPATEFDIIIPSSYLADEANKPWKDITGLKIPAGAKVYSVGIRTVDALDNNQNFADGTKITGTATNRLKVASALNSTATGVISATALGSDSSAISIPASGIVPVTQSRFSVITPVELSGELTLKLYVTASGGTTAGSAISSTANGGSYNAIGAFIF